MLNTCSASISITYFLMNIACEQLVKLKIPFFVHILIEHNLLI